MKNKVTLHPLSGSYENLSFPVLGVVGIHHELILYYNTSYKTFFLTNHEKSAVDTVLEQLKAIENKKMYHLHGQIYHVDIHEVSGDIRYFFFSPSVQSINNSFLWLKHDLLNILNPIVGFSDILSESTQMDEDEMMMVKRIKANAEKLYKEIQKIAALQQLKNQKFWADDGQYSMSDFIVEIVDKLINTEILPVSPKIVISHSGMVSAEISHIIYRSSLEEMLITLIKFQAIPELKILVFPYNHTFRLKFQLPKCQLPEQTLREINEIQDFLQAKGLINKLQMASANYLLLCELTQKIGGEVLIKNSANDVLLEIVIPIVNEAENQHLLLNTSLSTETSNQLPMKNIQPQQVESIKESYDKFGGFFILDEWEELARNMSEQNKEFQNADVERLIIEIQAATSNFDVERLRRINAILQQFFTSDSN